jgi:hypothetical protein
MVWIKDAKIGPAIPLTVEGAETAPEIEAQEVPSIEESQAAKLNELSDEQIEKMAEGGGAISATGTDDTQVSIPATTEEAPVSVEDQIARAIRIQRSKIVPERMIPDVPAGEGIMVGIDG